MKIAFSLFALAAVAAPTLAAPAAAPRLVGEVFAGQSPTLYLGGAYFPGKGFRNDVQSKWALYPGVRWQLFDLDGAGQKMASERGAKQDIPAGYTAKLRDAIPMSGPMKPFIAISNASPKDQPRLPKRQDLNQELYQRVAADLLRSKGLKNIKRARLTQLMRVDLNGDGTEEVLIAASSRPDYGRTPQEKKGDYSLLAIRYLDNGVVRARILDYNISRRNLTFSAPGYFEFISFVDVDGDGPMEIVGANGYYEGNGFEVWKFDGKSAKSVMFAGWGV